MKRLRSWSVTSAPQCGKSAHQQNPYAFKRTWPEGWDTHGALLFGRGNFFSPPDCACFTSASSRVFSKPSGPEVSSDKIGVKFLNPRERDWGREFAKNRFADASQWMGIEGETWLLISVRRSNSTKGLVIHREGHRCFEKYVVFPLCVTLLLQIESCAVNCPLRFEKIKEEIIYSPFDLNGWFFRLHLRFYCHYQLVYLWLLRIFC